MSLAGTLAVPCRGHNADRRRHGCPGATCRSVRNLLASAGTPGRGRRPRRRAAPRTRSEPDSHAGRVPRTAAALVGPRRRAPTPLPNRRLRSARADRLRRLGPGLPREAPASRRCRPEAAAQGASATPRRAASGSCGKAASWSCWPTHGSSARSTRGRSAVDPISSLPSYRESI